MSLDLVTNYNLGNGSKLVFRKFIFDDDAEVLTYEVELWRGGATDVRICGCVMTITNTTSTQLQRQTNPSAELGIGELGRYFVLDAAGNLPKRATPNAYNAARTADRAAADNKGARRTANETHQKTANHIDQVTLTNP